MVKICSKCINFICKVKCGLSEDTRELHITTMRTRIYVPVVAGFFLGRGLQQLIQNTWNWTHPIIKINLVLSVFRDGEALKTSEIIERLQEQGIDVTSHHALSRFIRTYLEHKYLQRVNEYDIKRGKFTTKWKKIAKTPIPRRTKTCQHIAKKLGKCPMREECQRASKGRKCKYLGIRQEVQ